MTLSGEKLPAVARAKIAGKPSSGGRFLRMNDVVATTGLSRNTIYRLVGAGAFPRQTALTTRCVGWWQRDVDQWLTDRLQGAPG